MKILMTNVQLDHRTGTEIVVRDLESALRRRGHDVCVYTPSAGAIADEIVASGGTVVTDLADLPFEPDIIHGHHHVETVEALVRCPTAGAVFVCHDRTSSNDVPVVSTRIRRYVSVDLNCDQRVAVEAAVPADRRRLVHNAVDLVRHSRRGPLPERPRRALVFSNNAGPGGYVEEIRAACAARGIALDVIGSGVGASSADPEAVLGTYDLVFAKARSALEAMAAGCAVVLVDLGGLGGLVTSADVERLRDWNFGARCLQRPVTTEGIGVEIDRYDASDSSGVTDWIRQVADLERSVDTYLDIYRDVLADPAPGGPPTTWVDLHRSLLDHAAVLEAVVRDLEGGAVARAIPPSVGREVEIELLRPPALVRPGEVRSRSKCGTARASSSPVVAPTPCTSPTAGSTRRANPFLVSQRERCWRRRSIRAQAADSRSASGCPTSWVGTGSDPTWCRKASSGRGSSTRLRSPWPIRCAVRPWAWWWSPERAASNPGSCVGSSPSGSRAARCPRGSSSWTRSPSAHRQGAAVPASRAPRSHLRVRSGRALAAVRR